MSLFLIICIIIVVLCFLNGRRKGVARILYGLMAWIFVFWFVNFATSYIQDYLRFNTKIEESILDKVAENLQEKYRESEEKEEGSGIEAIIEDLPRFIKNDVVHSMEETANLFIESISEIITSYILGAIAAVISIIIAFLFVWVVGKLLIMLDVIPGINDINKLLGGIAGIFEGIVVIWVLIAIAEHYPTSVFGHIVLPALNEDSILTIINQNNLIKAII